MQKQQICLSFFRNSVNRIFHFALERVYSIKILLEIQAVEFLNEMSCLIHAVKEILTIIKLSNIARESKRCALIVGTEMTYNT